MHILKFLDKDILSEKSEHPFMYMFMGQCSMTYYFQLH